jgi:hypothetical protein
MKKEEGRRRRRLPGCSGRPDLLGGDGGCARGRHRQHGHDRIWLSKGGGQGGGRGVGRGVMRAGDGRGGATRAHLSRPIFLARFHAGEQ